MDFETLLRKHHALLAENEALKEENLSLKIRLGLVEPSGGTLLAESERQEVSLAEPSSLVTIKADPAEKISLFMLFIDKTGISQKALNSMKRLAAFKNPEFYRLQAMRQSTYKEPPIISCSEETPEYLCLPRGCDIDLETVIRDVEVEIQWIDKTYPGMPIKVDFTGVLREDQEIAAEAMLRHDCGVLSATTAFGKTVVAARLIAERKVNTLILTHRQQLLSQWMARLSLILTDFVFFLARLRWLDLQNL